MHDVAAIVQGHRAKRELIHHANIGVALVVAAAAALVDFKRRGQMWIATQQKRFLARPKPRGAVVTGNARAADIAFREGDIEAEDVGGAVQHQQFAIELRCEEGFFWDKIKDAAGNAVDKIVKWVVFEDAAPEHLYNMSERVDVKQVSTIAVHRRTHQQRYGDALNDFAKLLKKARPRFWAGDAVLKAQQQIVEPLAHIFRGGIAIFRICGRLGATCHGGNPTKWRP